MKLGRTSRLNGFATISLLLFLPLLCALIFSFGFMNYLIQHKSKIRSTCLTEGRDIQKMLIQYEENLFRLNPLANTLRLRLKLAYVELAIATATKNLPKIAEVQIKISRIKADQKRLDSIQQTLIRAGNLQLKAEALALKSKLIYIGQDMNQIWGVYLRSLTTVHLVQLPEMAVVRDSPDLAPVYELHTDHKEKQKLAYKWQNRFKTKSAAQDFLNSETDIELYCSITVKNERKKWALLINVDKS